MATDGQACMDVDIFGVPWPELNDGFTYTDIIKDETTNLLDFYSSRYKDSAPPQGWVRRIRNGQIKIDGETVTDPHTALRPGSILLYHRHPWKEPNAPHLLEVLFEDDDILAVNKPSGLQVLAGGVFQQRTVLSQLQWRDGNRPECSGTILDPKTYPVPVHRLGRGTSGVLLCAKTKIAKAQLSQSFCEGSSKASNRCPNNGTVKRPISKVYRALAVGIITQNEVEIDYPIGRIFYPGVAAGLYVASLSGKPAWSRITVLERDLEHNQTLVQVEIYTGRAHQIRIHLAFMGHPLVEDPLYIAGGQPVFVNLEENSDCVEDGGYRRPMNVLPGDCGYHLHARQVTFCHPTKDQVIQVVARLPPRLCMQGEHPLP